MTERLAFLWPEIALFVTTCIVMVMGLSRNYGTRKATAIVAWLGVVVAGVLAYATTPSGEGLSVSAGQLLLPEMVAYAKVLIAIVGVMLLMLLAGTVDRVEEDAIAKGKRAFDPLRSNRAEFYSFFLFSLTGLMLCASADDLIWLFLALELTSLPTYIMVSISTARNRGREAGVKYFFLGALGAAVFLYGFALIYGGTGHTNLNEIALVFHTQGMNAVALAGVLLALLGLAFKIAAVPMHFYTADVYQGASAPVAAFLAFVPKTAGFLAILLIVATFGWQYELSGGMRLFSGETIIQSQFGDRLPESVRLLLWVMAALTMTVGNVLAILQTSVKRMLAYSSIAHSGYMLVGVIVGPGDGTFANSGVGAVLFYLLAYGVMNAGAFAAIASLERSPTPDGEPREVDHIDDLRGLCSTHPAAGWTLVVCGLSLLGLPPLLGFFGKLPLFTSALAAGEVVLVVVLGVNSAIAAFYYLRLAFLPLTERPDPSQEAPVASPFGSRRVGGLLSAGGVVVLAILGGALIDQVTKASRVSRAGDVLMGAQSPLPAQTAATLAPSGAPSEAGAPQARAGTQ
jgi:NADH-quinone oxidoreductase subunit N